MKKSGNTAHDARRQPSPKETLQDNNNDTGQNGKEGTREGPKHKKNPAGSIPAIDIEERQDLDFNSGTKGPQDERKQPDHERWVHKEDPAAEWLDQPKGSEDSRDNAEPTNNKKKQHYTYNGSASETHHNNSHLTEKEGMDIRSKHKGKKTGTQAPTATSAIKRLQGEGARRQPTQNHQP